MNTPCISANLVRKCMQHGTRIESDKTNRFYWKGLVVVTLPSAPDVVTDAFWVVKPPPGRVRARARTQRIHKRTAQQRVPSTLLLMHRAPRR